MRKKSIFFIVVFFINNCFFSQIAITEVYDDTPFNEKLFFTLIQEEAKKHHRGEFVEIYNYSDKDINLKTWFLRDKDDIFWLPDKIIKSGQFMVVAYSSMPANSTIFSEHFSTTLGKESQIIYQDKLLLRNQFERVSIGYTLDNKVNLIEKDMMEWGTFQQIPTNYIPNIWATPQLFYTVPSRQYHPTLNSADFKATPNPLEGTYKPTIQNYDVIVKDDYNNHYSLLDWSANVSNIVDKICSISIEKESQSSTLTTTGITKCFLYDIGGNRTSTVDCSPSSDPTINNGYTPDELENIKNSIILYPNPTQGQVTIGWHGAAINKIFNLQVFNTIGANVFFYNPTSGINSITFNIQNQLPGVFVANFTLNTGQVISKNILKW